MLHYTYRHIILQLYTYIEYQIVHLYIEYILHIVYSMFYLLSIYGVQCYICYVLNYCGNVQTNSKALEEFLCCGALAAHRLCHLYSSTHKLQINSVSKCLDCSEGYCLFHPPKPATGRKFHLNLNCVLHMGRNQSLKICLSFPTQAWPAHGQNKNIEGTNQSSKQ